MLKCAESACHGCGGGAVGDGGAFEGSSAVADEEDIVYLIGRSWSIWPKSVFCGNLRSLMCFLLLVERKSHK